MPTPTGIDLLDTTVVPAIQTLNPGASPLDPNTAPIGDALAAAQGLPNPFAESVPGLDVPESVPVTVTQDPSAEAIKPNAVTPQDVADARAHNEENGTVDKKVGETTRSSTQTVESEETRKAQAELSDAQAASKEATDLALTGVNAEAKANADLAEADNRVISTVEGARSQVIKDNQVKFQSALADIDSRVAELANFKPETFWGSKSQADKISAAISVGLGSFAQSLTGSGQNLGMVLLNRKMDEFDSNQKLEYQNKLNAIQSMRASLDEKRKLADDLDKSFDAQKLAARAQVQTQFARASAMAKTPQVQAGILQKQAEFDKSIANIHQEIAARHEQKITSTEQQDVIKKIQAQPGTTKDGKPLNENQAKAAAFYSQMSGALKNISQLDEQGIVSRGALGDAVSNKRADEDYEGIPVFGKAISGFRQTHGYNPEEILKKSDPEAYNYLSQAQPFINGVLRQESGAAIGSAEFRKAYDQYFPVRGDGPTEIKQKAERRQQALKDMYQSTNLAGNPK